MQEFDLDAYLARIGLDRRPRRDAAGLRALQVAQLRAIPFEDIDPFLGRTPEIALPAITAKILGRGRGGYCFELNTLLAAALAALGFAPRRAMARVRRADPKGGPRSHLLIWLDIDGCRWLADCGFGGPGPLVPLRLDETAPQTAPNGCYRLRPETETGDRVLERQKPDGAWQALYAFDLAHVADPDIAAANYLCAHWPEMPFGNHLMLAGFDGDTRIGLFDRALSRSSAAGETRSRIESRAELAALIARLGIPLSDAEGAAIWARLEGR